MTHRRFLDFEAVRIIHRERPDAEDALWEHLRRRRIGTLRFRRLDPVAGLLPSFTCRERRLVIDVTDLSPIGNAAMAARLTRFRAEGWWLMRIRGVDVMADPAAVCEAIRKLCRLEDAVPMLRLVKSDES